MMTRPSIRSRRRCGFTLVELLIVIAIVAVLTAVAIPVARNSSILAQRVVTISKLRQVGALAVTYTTDNNGILPDEGGEGVQSFSAMRTKPDAWYNALPLLG